MTDISAGPGDDTARGDTPRTVGLGRIAWWLAPPTILVYALVLAVPNAFVNDGFIYLAMVHSLVENGSLAFENGYEAYGSDALAVFFFIPVDGRLMPQYPSGWAFLAAPFYAIGGIRGLFLLNALATILTFWLIRATARTLFDDDRLGLTAALLYAFATYAFDYAGAVWPHAVTIACITAGMAAAATGWRRDSAGWYALAGLALGLGIHFRVDAVLAVPAIGVWILGAAARPWRGLGLFLVGLLPGLAAASAINFAKFGVLSPLSYGRQGATSATDLTFYAGLLPLVAAGGLAALSLGFAPVRRAVYRPAVALGLLGLALAAVALVPPLQALGLRLAYGAAGLVVDMRLFPDALSQNGITQLEDGTVLAYGWAKKALLQSMPYAAVVLLVLPRLFRGPDRAGVALCLLVALAILFPFAYVGWWGGRANHMRYLLHLAPALVILSALALRQIDEAPKRPLVLAAILGVGIPAAGVLAAVLQGRELIYLLQHSVPNALVLGIALLSLAALLLRGRLRAAAFSGLQGMVWAGVLMAFVSAWVLDLTIHQSYRSTNWKLTETARSLPRYALFNVFYPTWAFERIAEPKTLIASGLGRGQPYDPELVRRAFADGRAVFAQHPSIAERMVAAGDASAAELVHDDEDPMFQLFRMAPP